MKAEYTAVIFKQGGWYAGWCPEVKGAVGQGKTREECLRDIGAGVKTMLEYYRAEAMKLARVLGVLRFAR